MRRWLILLGCSLAFFAISCGENKTADSREQEPLTAPQSNQTTPVAQAKSGAPVPPRNAQFTILCQAVTGPGHVERAKEAKDELIKATKMKDWYVSHDEEKSTIYYGYYTSIEDPKLKADRIKIASMQDQIGNRPFSGALPVPVDSPDPTAPPQYNLVNAKGYWSLQIAAYQGAGRKEAAVESVLKARKEGVEAYYYHGPNVSAVCIGAWPEEAIRKQEMDGGSGVDQDSPLLVLGPGSELIPPEIREQYSQNLIDKDSGKKVEVIQQKVEVVDPTMRAAMQKYPTHSLNGYDDVTLARDPATGKMVSVPKPTMIVPIPHSETVLNHDMDRTTPSLLSPMAPAPQDTGRLRSVGQ